MAGRTLFQTILPAGIVADATLYNLSVFGLSLIAALVCLGLLVLVAMMASYWASKRLRAEMAGMSIILISMLLACLLALAVFVVLLVTNLRFPR